MLTPSQTTPKVSVLLTKLFGSNPATSDPVAHTHAASFVKAQNLLGAGEPGLAMGLLAPLSQHNLPLVHYHLFLCHRHAGDIPSAFQALRAELPFSRSYGYEAWCSHLWAVFAIANLELLAETNAGLAAEITQVLQRAVALAPKSSLYTKTLQQWRLF
eukprot:NODE_5222_length_683_cov_14.557554_g5059_i0.p1 GENE.NODE_5222_length_683_cov_14.557554_g5059_i0~~NODE_5222_length_683_cov_14.557554_g5059_i0.p1  ORF type:complete len:158 (-),score=33.61 NODE_5222_length_683_cov_14.557554_g5059_i0:77-550(-)